MEVIGVSDAKINTMALPLWNSQFSKESKYIILNDHKYHVSQHNADHVVHQLAQEFNNFL